MTDAERVDRPVPPPRAADLAPLLERRVRVPEHVVFREFAQETVVLNLQTGQYHGLNPTGGRMLKAVEQATSLREAAATLSDELPAAVETIERDLLTFCRDLSKRGLVETVDP
jgi:Coenzyme PQQ synthesis protein D (PqqD)